MKSLLKQPGIWIALWVTIGILVRQHITPFFFIVGLLLSGLMLTILGLRRRGWMNPMQNRIAACIIGVAITLITGFYANIYQKPSSELQPFSNQRYIWEGHLISEPQKKNKTWAAEVEITQVANQDSSLNCKGKIFLYCKDSSFQQIKAGTQVWFEGKLQELTDTGTFAGYNQYLRRNGISHRAFVKQIHVIRYNYSLEGMLFAGRRSCESAIRNQIKDEKAADVAVAMLLGIKNGLDKETKQQYLGAGAAHILAISGMHISLIFSFLISILCRFPLSRKLQLGIALVIVVGYGILTGGSPAVMRAVWMAVLVIIAKLLAKPIQPVNLLGIVWSLMLLINPTTLDDLGFLLSFAAVSGIYFLYPSLQLLIPTQNRILNRVKNNIALSIAAQAFTLPIVLVHFGKFPSWFLLTNLVAVPLSEICTYAGFLLLCLSWVPGVGQVLGFITETGLSVLNKVIAWISHLPYATVENLQINVIQAFILTLALLWITYYLAVKAKQMELKQLL